MNYNNPLWLIKSNQNYNSINSFRTSLENDFNLNIPLYVEKIVEDDLLSVEQAETELKAAWEASLKAERDFKSVLERFI